MMKIVPIQVFDYTIECIANTLKYLELQLFSAVTVKDILRCTRKDCESISTWVTFSNNLTFWVTTEVLSQPTMELKRKCRIRMIELMQACQSMYNYSSFMSIYSGLNFSFIYYLKQIREGCPEHLEKYYQDAEILASALSNFTNLRNAIKVNADNKPIPYLCIIKKDMTAMLEKKKLDNSSGNLNLFNNLSRITTDLILCQNTSSIDVKPNPYLLHYFVSTMNFLEERELGIVGDYLKAIEKGIVRDINMPPLITNYGLKRGIYVPPIEKFEPIPDMLYELNSGIEKIHKYFETPTEDNKVALLNNWFTAIKTSAHIRNAFLKNIADLIQYIINDNHPNEEINYLEDLFTQGPFITNPKIIKQLVEYLGEFNTAYSKDINAEDKKAIQSYINLYLNFVEPANDTEFKETLNKREEIISNCSFSINLLEKVDTIRVSLLKLQDKISTSIEDILQTLNETKRKMIEEKKTKEKEITALMQLQLESVSVVKEMAPQQVLLSELQAHALKILQQESQYDNAHQKVDEITFEMKKIETDLKEIEILITALLSIQQSIKILMEKKFNTLKNTDIAQASENVYLLLLHMIAKLQENNIEPEISTYLFSTITSFNLERQKIKDVISLESWQILEKNRNYYNNISGKFKK